MFSLTSQNITIRNYSHDDISNKNNDVNLVFAYFLLVL